MARWRSDRYSTDGCQVTINRSIHGGFYVFCPCDWSLMDTNRTLPAAKCAAEAHIKAKHKKGAK